MNDQNNQNPESGQTPPQPVVTPPVADTPSQPSIETPTSQPTPPLAPSVPTPVVSMVPPTATNVPPVASLQQGKRNLLWLWITIAIVVVAGIIAGVVLFTAKQSADKVAQDYTSASATYVKSVHDSVQNSDSIANAKTELEKSAKSKPVLKEVFLSELSGEYTKAKTLQTSVDKKVNDFSAGISELASIDAFITDNKEKYSDISSAVRVVKSAITKVSAIAAMEKVLTILEDAEKTTSETQFPTELAGTKKDIVAAYKAEVDSWKAMITALESDNSTAYGTAYDRFQLASDEESDGFVKVNRYYFDIPTKQRDLLKTLESSHDTTA